MEKLAILRWRSADASPDTDDLLAATDRLCRADHWATAFVEHTGDASGFRYGGDPDELVLSSAVTVWVDCVEAHEEVADQLPAAARTSVHLLTESVPLAWQGRDWPDGVASPGVGLLTCFPKLADVDHETFYARWHGSHTPLTFEVHPVRRYVRNVVTRSFATALDIDAIVTESFTIEDLLDFTRFYGGAEPEESWQDSMARIDADLRTFADMDRLQTAPVDEIILSSAPWER